MLRLLAPIRTSLAMSAPAALLARRDELPAKQRASRDLALNRYVVVLTVAAWRAWVETYVSTALAALSEPPVSRSDDPEYLLLLNASRPLIELAVRDVGRFSTPAATEVRRLLRLLGDDPWPERLEDVPCAPRSSITITSRS